MIAGYVGGHGCGARCRPTTTRARHGKTEVNLSVTIPRNSFILVVEAVMRYLALAIFLSGCTVTGVPTYTPDGREGYAINCGGALHNWSQCYTEAGKLCGASGYDVVDKTKPPLIGNTERRSLVVACK